MVNHLTRDRTHNVMVIKAILDQFPSFKNVLRRAVTLEDKDGIYYAIGWNYKEIGVAPHRLVKLRKEGIIRRATDAPKGPYRYLLVDKEGTRRALEDRAMDNHVDQSLKELKRGMEKYGR